MTTSELRRMSLLAGAAVMLSTALGACEVAPRGRADADPAPPVAAGEDQGEVTVVGEARIRHADWAELGYRWDWAGSPFLSAGGSVEFLDAYHDAVVAQESGSVVSVLNPATGAMVWSADLPGRASRLVGNVRQDSTLFSATETDLFELDMGTGNVLARRGLAHVVNTPPAVFGNLAVFGTGAGDALAYNRSFGVELWRYGVSAPVEATPVAIDDRTVAVVSQAGEVLILDTQTGRSIGRNRISGGLSNDPVSDGERVYLASDDQSAYCFEASGGTRVWRVRTSYPLRSQPVLHEGTLYVSSAEEGVRALDAATGEERWRLPELGNAWAAAERDGAILFWDGQTATAVDPEEGEVVRRVVLPGVRGLRTDRFVDGNLYAIVGAGTVLRFTPR